MTSTVNLDETLDEQHAAVLAMLPGDFLDLNDLEACRRKTQEFIDAVPAEALPDDVEISERLIPGWEDDPEVRIKLYTPSDIADSAPALVWIHGGGMVLFNADSEDLRCAQRAERHRSLVVSVDYRLAPETRAPGQIHDCYAAFRWVVANASELGLDADRIVLGGGSAGGGLAAGTALFARDHGGPMPSAQMLVYPMIDHSNTSPSSYSIDDPRVWNRQANIIAWEHYLGGQAPTIYSSPSTCTDLSGLPPAYVAVGTYDMFVSEDVAYAMDLNRAGVPCELHVYPGAFHASAAFLPNHPLSVRWLADEDAWLAMALAGDV